jgi:hypothetical protein
MNNNLVVVFSFALILMILMITTEWALNLIARGEPLNNNSSLGNKTSSLGNISIITPWSTGNERNNGSSVG